MSVKAERGREVDTSGVSHHEMEEQEQEYNNEEEELRLPDYYPLHQSTRRDLVALSLSEADNTDGPIRNIQNQLMDIVDQYITDKIEMNGQRVIKGSISVEEMRSEQSEIFNADKTVELSKEIASKMYGLIDRKEKFFGIFKEVKAEMMRLGNESDPLTLDTISKYYKNSRAETGLQQLQIHDYFMQLKNSDHTLKGDESKADTSDERLLKFKEKVYVTINPTAPVPNLKRVRNDDDDDDIDDDDDDDLELAGGVIDLNCPISKKLMRDPRKLEPCGHVFDAESLQDQRRKGVRKCAECGVPTTNVVADEVTALRLMAYKRDEQIESILKDLTEDNEDDVVI